MNFEKMCIFADMKIGFSIVIFILCFSVSHLPVYSFANLTNSKTEAKSNCCESQNSQKKSSDDAHSCCHQKNAKPEKSGCQDKCPVQGCHGISSVTLTLMMQTEFQHGRFNAEIFFHEKTDHYCNFSDQNTFKFIWEPPRNIS